MKEKHIINWFISSTPNKGYYVYNTNETIVSFNTLNRFYFHRSFDFNLNVFIFFLIIKVLINQQLGTIQINGVLSIRYFR